TDQPCSTRRTAPEWSATRGTAALGGAATPTRVSSLSTCSTTSTEKSCATSSPPYAKGGRRPGGNPGATNGPGDHDRQVGVRRDTEVRGCASPPAHDQSGLVCAHASDPHHRDGGAPRPGRRVHPRPHR